MELLQIDIRNLFGSFHGPLGACHVYVTDGMVFEILAPTPLWHIMISWWVFSLRRMGFISCHPDFSFPRSVHPTAKNQASVNFASPKIVEHVTTRSAFLTIVTILCTWFFLLLCTDTFRSCYLDWTLLQYIGKCYCRTYFNWDSLTGTVSDVIVAFKKYTNMNNVLAVKLSLWKLWMMKSTISGTNCCLHSR